RPHPGRAPQARRRTGAAEGGETQAGPAGAGRGHRGRVRARRGRGGRGDRLPHRRHRRRHRPRPPRPGPDHHLWRGGVGRAHLRHHRRGDPAMNMASQGRQTGSFGDELTNAAMIGLVGLFGLAIILRAAGSIAAFLTGTDQPAAGPAAGVGVLFRPGDPAAALDADGLHPFASWTVAVALLAALAAAGGWVWVRLRRHARKVETAPHTTAGIATSHEITTTASARALLKRAANLRPSLDSPT